MSIWKSAHCDKGASYHEECDGTVPVSNTEDGPNRYLCECDCHDREFNQRKCPACRGTGYVHDEICHGEYRMARPGKLL